MEWEGIVVHHSASHDVSANEIDRWHKSRGWNGIGYHFVIRKNGDIETGRPISQQGAHNRGKNKTHLGVCLTGDFTKDYPSQEQISSLIRLVRGLKNRFDIEKIEKHHNNCPSDNFPWDYFISNIKE